MKEFKVGDRVVVNNTFRRNSEIREQIGWVGIITGIEACRFSNETDYLVNVSYDNGRYNSGLYPMRFDYYYETPEWEI